MRLPCRRFIALCLTACRRLQLLHGACYSGSSFTCGRPMQIGSGENDFFSGRLADLRIYNRALSPAEIRDLGK